MKSNLSILKDKLNLLKTYGGLLSFSIGDYYIQFQKENNSEYINFEAVSYNFLDIISKKSVNDFRNIGFEINNGNYYKWVKLDEIDAILKDTAVIFEDIYKINFELHFEVNDDIEYPNKFIQSQNMVVNKTPIISNHNQQSTKSSNRGLFIIIALLVVCYFVFFDKDDKKSSSKEKIVNSEWDGSVSQVERYLKNNLNDPDSYQSISWSAVVKLNDTKETGFVSHQVRHKYRAKNSFGGYVVEEKMFKLDYQGNVVDVVDYAR